MAVPGDIARPAWLLAVIAAAAGRGANLTAKANTVRSRQQNA